jgi:hypothetical protein
MPEQLRPRIIIISDGLDGLDLAQSLKQADPPIPSHGFEHDGSVWD